MQRPQGARGFNEFEDSLFPKKAGYHQENRVAGRQFKGGEVIEVDTGSGNGDDSGKVADHAAGANVIGVRVVVDEYAAAAAQGDAIHPDDNSPDQPPAPAFGIVAEDVAEPGDERVTFLHACQPRGEEPVYDRFHRVAEDDIGFEFAKGRPERGKRPQILEGVETGAGHGDPHEGNPDCGQGVDCWGMVFGAESDDVMPVLDHRLSS